jgi:tungstate transport system permease protein
VNEIVEGFSQAGNLIVTFNPDLLQIAALSLYVSLCATILAAVITIPLGGLIHFREFR